MKPAAEWNELGKLFYRKRALYNLTWDGVKLDQSIVACSRFGGPIALVRDDRKLTKVSAAQTTKPMVRIFNAAGKPLSSFVWEEAGRLVALGWTLDDSLLCIAENGSVLPYSVQGELQQNQFSLGSEVAAKGILECHVWPTGLVARTRDNQLYTVTNLNEPRPQRMADAMLDEDDEVHSMAVIEPQFTVTGGTEVLLAVRNTILVVDSDQVQDQGLTHGPMLRMAVAPSGQLLACFTHDGRLLVMSTNFSKILPEFGTRSTIPPDQLVWCGVDSVMLYWDEILLMVGPYGDWVKYTYEEAAVLVPECDGVRILTATRHEFLQRVPDSLVSIFGIGSSTPGALLYDALELFDNQSARGDENLRIIGAALKPAVDECIEGAGQEFDIALQRMLLRAAAYGRTFLTAYPPNKLANMCKTLRVLNAARSPDTGIPLSYEQYQTLSPALLIVRLLSTHRHLLALRMSEMLGLATEGVLIHWASAKMAASSMVSDKALLDTLLQKLKGCPTISFAQIAANAHRRGRPRLAALLLDHEPRAAEQVPLLTSMGEDQRALLKAIESGDTDLVYLAVFHLWRKCSFAEFVKLVHAYTPAEHLFLAYCRKTDPELLKSYHFTVGDSIYAAEAIYQEAFKSEFAKGTGPESMLMWRTRLLEQSKELFAKSKEHAVQKGVCEEAARLLKLQTEIEAASRDQIALVGKSVGDTVRVCILANQHSAAARVRTEFKLPDKHFWWLKLKALVEKQDWMALEAFAKEKKSPIGYEAFCREMIPANAPVRETQKYIARVADLTLRAQLYADVGLLREASDTQALLAQQSSGMTSNLGAMFGSLQQKFG